MKVLTKRRYFATIAFLLICFAIAGCAKGTLSSSTNNPAPTPTPNGNPTPTPTPNGSPTPTPTPSGSPTPTPTPTASPTPTPAGHSVTLAWNGSSGSGVVSYNVYRSTSASGPFARVGNATGTSFTDTSVQAGLTYFYTVTAVSSANVESTESTLVSATVP